MHYSELNAMADAARRRAERARPPGPSPPRRAVVPPPCPPRGVDAGGDPRPSADGSPPRHREPLEHLPAARLLNASTPALRQRRRTVRHRRRAGSCTFAGERAPAPGLADAPLPTATAHRHASTRHRLLGHRGGARATTRSLPRPERRPRLRRTRPRRPRLRSERPHGACVTPTDRHRHLSTAGRRRALARRRSLGTCSARRRTNLHARRLSAARPENDESRRLSDGSRRATSH